MTKLSKGGFFERRFRLSERKTDVKTEFLAGLTTFMTMSGPSASFARPLHTTS